MKETSSYNVNYLKKKIQNFEELWFIFWNAFDTSLVG
jgi:hypothetical protein